MRSMTGYGKAQNNTSIGIITVELTSVNHKNLDIRLRLPEFCRFLEIEIRKLLKETLRRGHVEGFLKIERDEAAIPQGITLNLPVAKAYYKEAERFYQALGIQDSIETSWILNNPDVWQTPDVPETDEIRTAVVPVIREAINHLVKTRETEGGTLSIFFEQKLKEIRVVLKKIEILKNEVPALAREALTQKLKELNVDPSVNPDRLAQEVAYMAQRADIAEEVTRLASHVEAFKTRIHVPGTSGKELDFTIQEMNREVNTIGSKSISYGLSSLVIQLKEIINQMREQVQNVE